MKKVLIATSALVSAIVFSSAANAADVSSVGYDWTGMYFGVNAGVAWNNSEVNNDFKYEGQRYKQLESQLDSSQAAFTGGAMLGYNYQIDHIVLGAEADFNYLGFGDEATNSHDWTEDSLPGVTSSSKSSFDANWYGTLRGRLGYAVDNMLFYGTGGLAYGQMNAESDIKVEAYGLEAKWDGSAEAVNWGWTIGAGMEYGIDNWSLGVEYLFVDLGSAEWNNNQGGNYDFNVGADVEGSLDYQFSVVRATAKLRF